MIVAPIARRRCSRFGETVIALQCSGRAFASIAADFEGVFVALRQAALASG
jgi:hypothetical protein